MLGYAANSRQSLARNGLKCGDRAFFVCGEMVIPLIPLLGSRRASG